jgi:ERCC4-type nuclease
MIMVDDRTGSKELADLIPNGIPKEVVRLEYGDMAWVGNGPEGAVIVGVERKTISDLCNCIATGRLSGYQLLGLLENYWRIYILVEGIWRGDPRDGLLQVYKYGKWVELSLGNRRFTYGEVWKYLNTLSIMTGVVVWQTENPQATGAWLASTYGWWQKEWGRHKGHTTFHETTPPGRACLMRPTLVHRVAKELTGVGWDKAKEVSRKFNTIRELASTTEEELKEVPGIGKILAKRMVKEINGW